MKLALNQKMKVARQILIKIIPLTPDKWNLQGTEEYDPLSGSSTYPKLGQKSVINGNKG